MITADFVNTMYLSPYKTDEEAWYIWWRELQIQNLLFANGH